MGKGQLTHGDAKRGQIKRLYRIWRNMIQRCSNPNKPDYKYYGAQGICVCDEWKKYAAFKEWAVNNGYDDNLTLDRKNGEENYCPENCRWVDMVVQNNNKKDLPIYEYNGETHTMSEWSRILGLPRGLLKDRILKLGWSVERAFTTPVNKKYRPDIYGEFVQH